MYSTNSNMSVSESLDPAEPVVIKWEDVPAPQSPGTAVDCSVDEVGFLERQKRKISDYPKISQLHLARATSKHNITFIRKAVTIIGSLMFFKILFFLLRLIPISKIIVFGIYMNKCPAQPMIQMYLLLSGCAACFRDVISLMLTHCCSKECIKENEGFIAIVGFLYTIFEFLLFIFGSAYVFITFNKYQSKDNSKDDYCNPVFYMYALIVTIISYILLFLVIGLSCCALLVARYTEPSKLNKSSSTMMREVSQTSQ